VLKAGSILRTYMQECATAQRAVVECYLVEDLETVAVRFSNGAWRVEISFEVNLRTIWLSSLQSCICIKVVLETE
jgi:hypothetical protein